MKLNQKTDYALRILLYAAEAGHKTVTSGEIAEAFNVTPANVTQMVNILKKKGYLNVQRGRYGGGLTLARPAHEILIGDTIKDLEPDMDLVMCFNLEKNTCPAMGACRLAGHLAQGLQAFIDKMNEKSLADLI